MVLWVQLGDQLTNHSYSGSNTTLQRSGLHKDNVVKTESLKKVRLSKIAFPQMQ